MGILPIFNQLNVHSTNFQQAECPFNLFIIGQMPIQNCNLTSWKLVKFPFNWLNIGRMPIWPVENWLNPHSTGWILVECNSEWAIDQFSTSHICIRTIFNRSNGHSTSWKLVDCPFDWLKIGWMPIRLGENGSNAHATGWKLVKYQFNQSNAHSELPFDLLKIGWIPIQNFNSTSLKLIKRPFD